MELPDLPRGAEADGSVWAISIVKNEADIIALSVLHHLRQGVDGVLVVDNGSTDGTLEILHDMSRQLPVFVGVDSWSAWDQAAKTEVVVDHARRAGARWIVPFDADEFWFAENISVAEHLRRTDAAVVFGRVHNLFPTDAEIKDVTADTEFRLDVTEHGLRKVAFRSSRLITLDAGNHYVHRAGRHRTELRLAHVPWRSLGQMTRKVVDGSSATMAAGLAASVNAHWNVMAEMGEEGLRQTWHRIVAGQPVEGTCWSPIGPFEIRKPLRWRTWRL